MSPIPTTRFLLPALALALPCACTPASPAADPDPGADSDAGDPGTDGGPGGADAAAPVTVTLGAAAQARVHSGGPDEPGPTGILLVLDYPDQLARSYVRFDVSAIPAGATVESAKLELYYCRCDGIDDIAVAAAAGGWDPATLTWNNQPGMAGGAIDVVNLNPESATNFTCGDTGTYVANTGGYASKPGWFVDSLVQRWVDGEANHGLVLRAEPEVADPYPAGLLMAVFSGADADGGCPANSPRLRVSYRP